MGATEQVLAALRDAGTQEQHLPAMQTRTRLYDLIRYQSYAAFDVGIADFSGNPGPPGGAESPTQSPD